MIDEIGPKQSVAIRVPTKGNANEVAAWSFLFRPSGTARFRRRHGCGTRHADRKLKWLLAEIATSHEDRAGLA